MTPCYCSLSRQRRSDILAGVNGFLSIGDVNTSPPDAPANVD